MSEQDVLFALDIAIGVALGITVGGIVVFVGWLSFLALSERRLASQRRLNWFRSEFVNPVLDEFATLSEAEQERREGEFAERLRSLKHLWTATEITFRDVPPPDTVDPRGPKGK